MMAWGFDGWVWMAVWIAALFGMCWLLLRSPGRPGQADALDILRARFARGEISQEEFERACAALLEHQ